MPDPAAEPASPIVDPSALEAVEAPAEERPSVLLVVGCPHAVDMVEPPPSKAELEVVSGQGDCSGLTPGVLSSVAPSGIPLGPVDAGEADGSDRVPSGDVVPMPVVVPIVVVSCARTGTPPSDHTMPAMAVKNTKLFLIVSPVDHDRQLI
jgi:hypothetical protein